MPPKIETQKLPAKLKPKPAAKAEPSAQVDSPSANAANQGVGSIPITTDSLNPRSNVQGEQRPTNPAEIAPEGSRAEVEATSSSTAASALSTPSLLHTTVSTPTSEQSQAIVIHPAVIEELKGLSKLSKASCFQEGQSDIRVSLPGLRNTSFEALLSKHFDHFKETRETCHSLFRQAVQNGDPNGQFEDMLSDFPGLRETPYERAKEGSWNFEVKSETAHRQNPLPQLKTAFIAPYLAARNMYVLSELQQGKVVTDPLVLTIKTQKECTLDAFVKFAEASRGGANSHSDKDECLKKLSEAYHDAYLLANTARFVSQIAALVCKQSDNKFLLPDLKEGSEYCFDVKKQREEIEEMVSNLAPPDKERPTQGSILKDLGKNEGAVAFGLSVPYGEALKAALDLHFNELEKNKGQPLVIEDIKCSLLEKTKESYILKVAPAPQKTSLSPEDAWAENLARAVVCSIRISHEGKSPEGPEYKAANHVSELFAAPYHAASSEVRTWVSGGTIERTKVSPSIEASNVAKQLTSFHQTSNQLSFDNLTDLYISCAQSYKEWYELYMFCEGGLSTLFQRSKEAAGGTSNADNPLKALDASLEAIKGRIVDFCKDHKGDLAGKIGVKVLRGTDADDLKKVKSDLERVRPEKYSVDVADMLRAEYNALPPEDPRNIENMNADTCGTWAHYCGQLALRLNSEKDSNLPKLKEVCDAVNKGTDDYTNQMVKLATQIKQVEKEVTDHVKEKQDLLPWQKVVGEITYGLMSRLERSSGLLEDKKNDKDNAFHELAEGIEKYLKQGVNPEATILDAMPKASTLAEYSSALLTMCDAACAELKISLKLEGEDLDLSSMMPYRIPSWTLIDTSNPKSHYEKIFVYKDIKPLNEEIDAYFNALELFPDELPKDLQAATEYEGSSTSHPVARAAMQVSPMGEPILTATEAVQGDAPD